VHELVGLIKAVKADLPRIGQRTLIVHARDDDLAGLSNAFYLQRHLGGLVETLVLDDSYHLVTVDRQRGIVMERVAAFVKTLVADGRIRAPSDMECLHAV
jgi:carboxylesterase